MTPTLSLSREEAFRRLEEGNPTLAQARSRAQEARAVTRQAAAALLPTLGATGNYTRNSDEAVLSIAEIFSGIEDALNQISPLPVELDTSALPDDTVIQPLQSLTGTVALRVPLFAANAYADVAAASELARAQALSSAGVQAQLRLALLNAAWLAWSAKGYAEAAEKALFNARLHRDVAVRAKAVGTGTALAAQQAEAEVVRWESEGVQARANVARAQLATGILLGEDEPVVIELSPPSTSSGEPLESVEQEALQNRPELQAQTALTRAALRQRDSAWLRFAPTVTGSFVAFASDTANATGKKSGWRLTFDLTVPLYDGGFRYGKKRQGEAVLSSVRAGLKDQTLQVRQQVRDASRDRVVAEERHRLAETRRALAQAAAESAHRAYQAGLLGPLEARDADQQLFMAEVGAVDALAKWGIAEVSLLRASGKL